MSVITSRLTANLEVITIKTEVFTNPARFHCFPSRFDHRAPLSVHGHAKLWVWAVGMWPVWLKFTR